MFWFGVYCIGSNVGPTHIVSVDVDRIRAKGIFKCFLSVAIWIYIHIIMKIIMEIESEISSVLIGFVCL